MNLKNIACKDRFRELAAEVLNGQDGLTSMLIREKVLVLAEEQGRATKSLSGIGHLAVHSVLIADKQKRFRRIDTTPLTWELVIND